MDVFAADFARTDISEVFVADLLPGDVVVMPSLDAPEGHLSAEVISAEETTKSFAGLAPMTFIDVRLLWSDGVVGGLGMGPDMIMVIEGAGIVR